MVTDDQFQKLKALKTAITDVEAAFPGNRDARLLHGFAARLLAANRAEMTDEQYNDASGGNEKDGH